MPNQVLTETTVLTGTVNEIASVTYRFNDGTEQTLNPDETGAFDTPLNLEGLSQGEQTLTITATDIAGNVGTTDLVVTVGEEAVNNPPVITVPDGQTVAEDEELTITGISVDDLDSNELEVQITVTNGIVSLSQTNGLTFVGGDGLEDSAITFTGSVTDVNNALVGLVYRGNQDFNGNDEILLTVSDGELNDTETIAVTVTPVNDAPVLTVPDAQTLEILMGNNLLTN